MTYLLLGLALFAIPHLFSLLVPAGRAALRNSLGLGVYKGVYSLASLVGIGLIVLGYHIVSNDPAAAIAYEPNLGLRHLTMTMVLLTFILLGASHGKGYIRKWVRQPMSVGILLWSVGHLLVNGKVYDLWLFGTFAVVSAIDIVVSEMRGKVPTFQPRLRSDIIAVVAGIALYAVVLFWFHPYVIGLPILG